MSPIQLIYYESKNIMYPLKTDMILFMFRDHTPTSDGGSVRVDPFYIGNCYLMHKPYYLLLQKLYVYVYKSLWIMPTLVFESKKMLCNLLVHSVHLLLLFLSGSSQRIGFENKSNFQHCLTFIIKFLLTMEI